MKYFVKTTIDSYLNNRIYEAKSPLKLLYTLFMPHKIIVKNCNENEKDANICIISLDNHGVHNYYKVSVSGEYTNLVNFSTVNNKLCIKNTTLRLYHGSRSIISTPMYNTNNKHKDLGSGFYLSFRSEDTLKYIHKNRSRDLHYINSYYFSTKDLIILDLTNYNILYQFVLMAVCRNISIDEELKEKYLIDTTQFDCLIGYSVDREVVCDYFRGNYSDEEIKMLLKEKQFVVISNMAYQHLRFLDVDVQRGKIL